MLYIHCRAVANVGGGGGCKEPPDDNTMLGRVKLVWMRGARVKQEKERERVLAARGGYNFTEGLNVLNSV